MRPYRVFYYHSHGKWNDYRSKDVYAENAKEAIRIVDTYWKGGNAPYFFRKTAKRIPQEKTEDCLAHTYWNWEEWNDAMQECAR